ncbi:MAG: thioredoxin [Candidatus Aminicenantia bacterium]
MNSLINSKTAKELEEKFKKELKQEVDLKVFARSITIKDEDPQYTEFAKKFVNELSEIDSRIKPEFYSLEDDLAKKWGITSSPTILIGQDLGYRIIYNGAPLGMEASSFIETISLVSQGKSNLSQGSKDKLKNIDKEVLIRVFVTPTCPYCPQAVLLANQIAIEAKGQVTAECVEANENAELSNKFNVFSVPQQVINDDLNSVTIGVQPEDKFIELVLKYGSSNYSSDPPKNSFEELKDNPETPIILNQSNFDQVVKKYPVLVVDFWAPWCGPCQIIAPIIENLARDYRGKVIFGKLNTDEDQEIAIRYGIMSIPTLLIFKNGEKVEQLVGAMPRASLESKLKKYLS